MTSTDSTYRGHSRAAIRYGFLTLGFALAVGFLATPLRAELIQTGPDIFGTHSVRSNNITLFPKWSGTLDRYVKERQSKDPPCTSGLFTSCPHEDWVTFLNSLTGLSPEHKMRRVNAFHNRTRYIQDIVNWRVADYWATPLQFLSKDGDCEDYAISKFMSLRALGFKNDQMRILVVRDLNLRLAHAVLLVELNGEKFILDNQIREAIPASAIHHYQAIYSINETNWWMHRKG